MAEGDASVYYYCKLYTAWDQLAWGGGGWPWYMMLVHDYTPNLYAHQKYADVSAQEYPTANGYTAGGVQALNFDWAVDSGSGVVTISCDSVTWANLGPLSPNLRPSHAIIYSRRTGVSPDLYHLGICWELGLREPDGGPFSLIVPVSGILQLV